MARGGEAELPLDADEWRRLRDILTRHDVELAAVFGSTARTSEEPNDLDLAIEFADSRPGEDGYASAYLGLYSALEDDFTVDIDVVDVHSMSSSFASVVFSDALVIFGDEDRFEALAGEYGGDPPSVTEARDRIAAVAARLGEGST